MSKGPHGYGRYNDAPDHVGCPRAQSDMTPCIARDGALALAGRTPAVNGVCVGCGAGPRALLHEVDPEANTRIGRDESPAIRARAAADELTRRVWDLTEGLVPRA